VGRRHYIAISAAIALSFFFSGSSFAQGPSQGSRKRGGNAFRRTHEFNGARERIYRLSPEERQTFKKNAERWLQMGPEERNMLRQREQIRRERLRREADAAMKQLDLSLDQGRRDQFENRYLQERRKIERALRKDLEDKRQQQLPEMNQRLKSEFQPQSPPAATASPLESAKPRR
jgi:hypothetical protein